MIDGSYFILTGTQFYQNVYATQEPNRFESS